MSLTKTTYSIISDEIENVFDYKMIADDENAASNNDAAIQLAINSGKPLFWLKGVYTFSNRIKIGFVNATAKWFGTNFNIRKWNCYWLLLQYRRKQYLGVQYGEY